MFVLRLVGILVLIAVAGGVALYLLTRNRRYLTFAWRVFQFGLIFLLVFVTLYALERVILVI
jgi:hypothetical protein